MSTDTTRPALLCPEGRWTRLPDALLSELTPREHQLVHALLSYKWTDDAAIYPSVPTLARKCRCSERTVQRTLRSLEGKGYVVTVARYRDESDHGQTSNTYAPGPMLLPLLSPPGGRDVAGPGDTHGGQTTKPRNHYKRTGTGTGHKPSDDRCPRCPHTSHDGRCSRCGCRDYERSDYLETRWGRLVPRT